MSVYNKPSLLIIGAGAAGLMAAGELCEKYDVTVLEALGRPGGRIESIPAKNGMVELGAEFVHGDLPVTLSLVKEAGLTLEEVEGKMFHVSDCEWKEEEEMIEGWDELLSRMESLEDDLTLDGFLETYFAHPSHENLRRHTRAYAAGFDLADPTRVSVKALYKEWSQEPVRQYRIREGYSALVDHLRKRCEEKGCTVRYNKKVKQVTWLKNEVSVLTSENEKYTAQKILVTLPAGVMQEPGTELSVHFQPRLDAYEAAWKQVGNGSVLKVILDFKQAFWEREHADAGFIFSEEIIPTWWTRSANSTTLTGWLGGPAAVQWDGMNEAQILEAAITSLARIFKLDGGMIASVLSQHYITRFHKRPTALGAYSYETPWSATAREILTTPVEDTLYFAGEALYGGAHPGTVEAALTSGLDAANRVLKALE